MKPDPQIGQGRNGDVPHDPDGFGITFRFYGWVALIITIICAGLVFLGWPYGLGVVSGAGIAALLACFALGKAAPW